FWLVLGAAWISVGLGYAVGVAARRRRDARLFLVSLAFISAAGFLGLPALPPPRALPGQKAGRQLAAALAPRQDRGLLARAAFRPRGRGPLRGRLGDAAPAGGGRACLAVGLGADRGTRGATRCPRGDLASGAHGRGR